MDIVKEITVSSRLTTEEIVRGMGAGAKVIELLDTSIAEVGGDTAILALMTRPRFKSNVIQIAKAMVGCDWRIPASEMRQISSTKHGHDVDDDFAGKFWWFIACNELGLPREGYDDNPDGGMYPPIPSAIRQKIDGKKFEYPLFLDDRYVVVDIGFDEKSRCEEGDTIKGHGVRYITLVKRSYFDFDK